MYIQATKKINSIKKGDKLEIPVSLLAGKKRKERKRIVEQCILTWANIKETARYDWYRVITKDDFLYYDEYNNRKSVCEISENGGIIIKRKGYEKKIWEGQVPDCFDFCFLNYEENTITSPSSSLLYESKSPLDQHAIEQWKYYDYWRKNIEKEVYPDINGNLGYVIYYVNSRVERCLKENENTQKLLYDIKRIKNSYNQYTKLEMYINDIIAKLYLNERDFDNAWLYLVKGKIRIEDVINFRGRCSEAYIDGSDLNNILKSENGLTKFGKERIEQIIEIATAHLDAFHKKYDNNIIEYLYSKYDIEELMKNNFEQLAGWYRSESDFHFDLDCYNKYYAKYGPQVSVPFRPFGSLNGTSIDYIQIPSVLYYGIYHRLQKLMRKCENILRQQSNLPKIGEGWIEETKLFSYICAAFPHEKVVQHGRPSWLKSQHLDIYLPIQKIGIEYQGIQHERPVEYFGGLDTFEKQQKLDKRKRELCEINDCRLIYVYENYDFENVKSELETLLKGNNIYSNPI